MNDYKNFNKKYAHNIELMQKWLLIWVSEGIKMKIHECREKHWRTHVSGYSDQA